MVKQVIVVRRDLKMRRGKEIAQGSHASMAFLVRRLRRSGAIEMSDAEREWLFHHQAKICVRVESEAELLDVHARAIAAGLESHLIRDAGHTEFGGVPTLTCCAVGPDDAEKIDAITGGLTLY
ncbi:MAG: aminoacyl-tRNA hydrolase [Deltaproteobacteria bacterium]|nr:aminoacyl-tRNA hydrolase [Deltaproteobacteria bacterium]